MSNVILDISMSLDGYVTASDRTAAEPLGKGGAALHEWTADPTGQEVLARGGESLGAVITGRRNFDDALPWWGQNGPTGERRVPLFVVTNRPIPDTGVYHFTPSIESALSAAEDAAGAKDVTVMGGADIARQFLKSGLVKEIQLHLVPVLFGAGTPLFADLRLDLTPLEVIDTPAATHLRYRVNR